MTLSQEILILVGDTNTFSKIQEYISKYPSAKILSLNFISHSVLSAKKIPHEIAENILNDQDYLKINNLTKYAVKNWYGSDNLKHYLDFSGINLGSLMEMELHHYFLPLYTNALLIKYILSKFNPKMIITSTNIDNFIIQSCKQHHVECITLEKEFKSKLVFDNLNIKINLYKFPISLKISRKTYSYIKNFLEKITYIFLGL